jgi:hypothetical protein
VQEASPALSWSFDNLGSLDRLQRYFGRVNRRLKTNAKIESNDEKRNNSLNILLFDHLVGAATSAGGLIGGIVEMKLADLLG